jgi:hypothetical protein
VTQNRSTGPPGLVAGMVGGRRCQSWSWSTVGMIGRCGRQWPVVVGVRHDHGPDGWWEGWVRTQKGGYTHKLGMRPMTVGPRGTNPTVRACFGASCTGQTANTLAVATAPSCLAELNIILARLPVDPGLTNTRK